MKTPPVAKTVFAAIAATLALAPIAQAQQPSPKGANSQQFGVAVVDIGYIFKNHAGFKAKMETMKAEVKRIEQELEKSNQQVIGMEEQKRQFNPGSAEFSSMDDKIAKAKADLQLKMQKSRKELMQRESKVYYETYTKVSQAIETYAKYYKIGMVLRFRSEPADPMRREQVLAEINKPVQFQNQINITDDILSMLNRQPAPTGGTATNPRAGAPPRNY